VRSVLAWVKIWAFRMRSQQTSTGSYISRFQAWDNLECSRQSPRCSKTNHISPHLLKLITTNGWDRGIESRNTGLSEVSCNIINVPVISLFVFEMSEVEPSQTISLEFNKSGRYDQIIQIYYLCIAQATCI